VKHQKINSYTYGQPVKDILEDRMLVRGVRRSVVSGKFNEWILSRIGTFLFPKNNSGPVAEFTNKSNRPEIQ
jgi:hypothetical protein